MSGEELSVDEVGRRGETLIERDGREVSVLLIRKPRIVERQTFC